MLLNIIAYDYDFVFFTKFYLNVEYLSNWLSQSIFHIVNYSILYFECFLLIKAYMIFYLGDGQSIKMHIR